MSWSRFDDNWSDRMGQLGMTHLTRVHYMAMIQFCSRTDKYDGALKPVDAKRASDLDDPQSHIDELVNLGLVTRYVTGDGERYKLVEIDEHVPPPHLRETNRKTSGATRVQRHRAHKAGNHSLCLPANCPEAPDVTRYPGTGQDGPRSEEVTQTVTDNEDPAAPFPPGDVDLITGEVREPATNCGWCGIGSACGCKVPATPAQIPAQYAACVECGDLSGDCRCFDEESIPA